MSKAGHPKLAHQIARGQLSFQDHEPHPQASCHHPTCCLASGATCQLWHSLSHPPVLPSVWKHSSNLKQGQDKTLTYPVCVCVLPKGSVLKKKKMTKDLSSPFSETSEPRSHSRTVDCHPRSYPIGSCLCTCLHTCVTSSHSLR